jgi:hypothetical protein
MRSTHAFTRPWCTMVSRADNPQLIAAVETGVASPVGALACDAAATAKRIRLVFEKCGMRGDISEPR